MDELKPCPFCGGEAHLMDMGWPHWVWCSECGARVQSTKFDEEGDAEAIAKWNMRTEPSSYGMTPFRIGEIIGELHYVAELIDVAAKVMRQPNCNDCAVEHCEYKPEWGMPVRYNCPLHVKREARK